MNAINPYQPSGSSQGELLDGTKPTTRLGSFLVKQFLVFVPTVFVLHFTFVCWFAWQIGWGTTVTYFFNKPYTLVVIASFDFVFWLFHAFFIVVSGRFRRASPVLNGIAGAVSIAITVGLYVMLKQAQPQLGIWIRSFSVLIVIGALGLVIAHPYLVKIARSQAEKRLP